MRIGLPTGVVQSAVDETITGAWTFANALGLLTDVITERSAGVGVTVDGLLIRDSGIPQAAVTAHEAAFSILETQIVDGTLLARLAAAEVITGLYAFAHASGLQTDVISERTGAAGVSIDGFRILDSALDNRDYAGANDLAMALAVSGDAQVRYVMRASGLMLWGDGAAAGDTNLFRAAANELATDDDFNVGGTLDLGGAIEGSVLETSLGAGNHNDLNTGTTTIFRINGTVITVAITGLNGGAAGRMLFVQSVGAVAIELRHENANSAAANRIRTPGSATLVLDPEDGAILWYDSTTSRWRVVGVAQ